MQNTWSIRLLIVLGMLGVALYFLVPSVIYFSLDEAQTQEVRQNRGAFAKHLPSWAPQSHIVPGLDLQGGVHMVLGVDLEKAVSDRASRAAQRLRNELDSKQVAYESAQHLIDADTGYGDRVELVFKTPAARETFEKDVARLFSDMTVASQSGTRVVMRVHPDLVAQVHRDAVDQTMKTIRNRIDKMGVTEPSLAKRGDDQIQIQLPGYNNPEEAKSLIGRTAQLEFMMTDDTADFLSGFTDLPSGVQLQQSAFQRPDGGYGNDIVYGNLGTDTCYGGLASLRKDPVNVPTLQMALSMRSIQSLTAGSPKEEVLESPRWGSSATSHARGHRPWLNSPRP
jgi:preprotein translocase subunit SecD